MFFFHSMPLTTMVHNMTNSVLKETGGQNQQKKNTLKRLNASSINTLKRPLQMKTEKNIL